MLLCATLLSQSVQLSALGGLGKSVQLAVPMGGVDKEVLERFTKQTGVCVEELNYDESNVIGTVLSIAKRYITGDVFILSHNALMLTPLDKFQEEYFADVTDIYQEECQDILPQYTNMLQTKTSKCTRIPLCTSPLYAFMQKPLEGGLAIADLFSQDFLDTLPKKSIWVLGGVTMLVQMIIWSMRVNKMLLTNENIHSMIKKITPYIGGISKDSNVASSALHKKEICMIVTDIGDIATLEDVPRYNMTSGSFFSIEYCALHYTSSEKKEARALVRYLAANVIDDSVKKPSQVYDEPFVDQSVWEACYFSLAEALC
ncbi:MAG: hypothetical protein OXC30_03505 [Alphaproteobacteria bacterium]|nr:hypothetical protein [Alphaproteobacteria bacterium]